jgi:two-component system phosphate regulon sensor histidine kinase PhoR
MPNVTPEIKSSRLRNDWSQVLSFVAVFLPLAIAATLWAIFGFGVGIAIAVWGCLLFSSLSLVAMAIATSVNDRRIARQLESVSNVVWQMSAGEFDARVPPRSRQRIEELAASLDNTQLQLKSRIADLEASRNQLRTVLNSMVEGVIAIDSDQRVLLVNEAACRLFPIHEVSAAGRPLWELVRSPQLQQWMGLALSQSDPVGGELELKAPVPRQLSVRVAGLPGPTAAGAIVVASDVSQLRRLEQVRQEFVANASHELKTPLASIKACVETLLDGALDDVEQRVRFLQMVNEQTERLDKLVRDLLALTQIESQDRAPVLHAVPLADIVTLCVNRHRQHAERKEMRLVTHPPPEPVQVQADEESLEQIFDNLIDNAVKYTNSGGTITVRWEVDEDRCRVDVEDTGIGIPQAHLPRIFERFYRVDRARSRELGGTGLGLSIVKHLVQILGGTVSVSSRLGKGTTFSVELKLAL